MNSKLLGITFFPKNFDIFFSHLDTELHEITKLLLYLFITSSHLK